VPVGRVLFSLNVEQLKAGDLWEKKILGAIQGQKYSSCVGAVRQQNPGSSPKK
jgi:hypothetical protein